MALLFKLCNSGSHFINFKQSQTFFKEESEVKQITFKFIKSLNH